MEQRQKQYKDINTLLSEQAERHPGKVYIESPDQEKNITFEQAKNWCNRVANFLRERGIRPNDKIIMVGENSMETLMLYFGILNYGAAVSPINVEESKENVYRLINLVKPKIVFYGEELTFDQGQYKAGSWIPYSYSGIEGGLENEFFASLKSYDSTFESPVATKDDLGTINFTSGTTAIPKAVVWTREAVFYMPLDTVERLGITEQDVILDYRAYSWSSPQILSILSSLIAGATLVYGRRFSRSRFPSWLKEYGITICVGVPTVINFLLEEEVPLKKKDIPSLRFMTSSSAPLLKKNQLTFEESYGILINQGAGGTESGWLAMNDPEDLNRPEKRKVGSIGKSPPNKETFIIDEQGNRLKSGEEGEIAVKGKSTALGYLGDNGEITEFPDGVYRTGDLGFIDGDGFIFITGRKKELIIRGGVNISPMEITNWLVEHPAVQEAVTVGVPDKVRGEEVASFIIPKEGHQISQEDIIDHCKKKLPDFKFPKTIYFVEQFPKTQTGKILKRELVKIWEEMQEKGVYGGTISPEKSK